MSKKTIVFQWDESVNIEDEIKHLQGMDGEDITRDEALEQSMGSDWGGYWESFTDKIDKFIGDRNYWKIEGKNIGWNNRSGWKVFEADNAMDFLEAFTPNCDYTLTGYKYYGGAKITLSHHDSPTGEFYTLKPISEKEFNELV